MVRSFELLRTDGSRRRCSPTENPDWFAATVGGLGLTGLITWAEIQPAGCQSLASQRNDPLWQPGRVLYGVSAASDRDYEYTVAWLDCASRGAALGQGLSCVATMPWRCAPRGPRPPTGRLNVPFTPPFSLINRWSLRAFNTLYYHRQWREITCWIVHCAVLYPLDRVLAWNRIYGRHGFCSTSARFRRFMVMPPFARCWSASRVPGWDRSWRC